MTVKDDRMRQWHPLYNKEKLSRESYDV